MKYRDWLPALWSEDKDNGESPFTSLRKQIDTLFEDLDGDIFKGKSGFAVRSNVSETEKEICITAELPGLEEKDVDVSVSGNRISIKGEKKSEVEEKKDDDGREFHRIERSSGSFQRMMNLPFDIDSDKVKATVKDGILTVTIPKPAELLEKTKKITVKSG